MRKNYFRSLLYLVIYLGVLSVSFWCMGCSVEVDQDVPIPNTLNAYNKGKELVDGLAACGFCHGGTSRSSEALLSGGLIFKDKYGEVAAPNITPSRKNGIGKWSPLEFKKLFRSGENPKGRYVSHEAHEGFQWMSDGDLMSIASYLSSLPPVEKKVEARTIGFFSLNTWGKFEEDVDVAGYVPHLKVEQGKAYGHYLAHHVARCTSCHNSPSTFFGDPELLGGGKYFSNEAGTEKAPKLQGITRKKNWSKDALLNYLQTGRTPNAKPVDSRMCPTKFFKNASGKDLAALVEYLDSIR
jgi:hypothetical protein